LPEQPAKRMLTTIFYADVVDYSRLTGLDEEGTHHIVMGTLDNVSQKISSAGGTVLRYAGDAILATFPSVVRAVETSTDIQSKLTEDNALLPEETRVHIRIGINLGDVIEDRGEVFGDGVNLAARLEAAAVPGGICISSMVWEQCQGKINSTFADGGEQQFKNISRPVRTFHWEPSTDRPSIDLPISDTPLTDKPSIAVLPFDNMSGDTDQEYFSEGITEDIITDLSKVSSLFVVARNSSFTYKGRSVKAQEICVDLGVRYIVEGSVRKVGSKVRITAQLIDGKSGGHIWADRYDGTLDDIFDLQDKVTYQIVDALKVRLLPEEEHAIRQVPTTNIQAYDYYLKGRQFFHIFTEESLLSARDCFIQAINCDDSFAQPYCGLADTKSFLRWNHDGDYLTLVQAIAAANDAIKLAPDLADGHASLGLVLSYIGEFPGAENEFNIALQLDPNLYEAHYYWGRACVTEGKLKEAANHLEAAWKQSPTDPQTPSLLLQIYRSLGQYKDLEHAAKETVKMGIRKLEAEPDDWRSCLSTAFGYLNLGKFQETDKYLQRALVNNPEDATISYNIACLYCGMDDIERALKYLNKFLELSGGQKPFYNWMKNDSDLDPLRDNPEFQKMLDRYF